MPIYEPGLEDLVKDNARDGRLSFAIDGAEAIREADAVFIAVGTPTRRGDGHADLSYVYAAAEEIAGLIDGFTVIVTKSTVPVGTGDEIEAIIRARRPDADFAVVSNPEFLREGAAIEEGGLGWNVHAARSIGRDTITSGLEPIRYQSPKSKKAMYGEGLTIRRLR